MEYRGYKIENEFGHYNVTPPDGKSGGWTEDTIEEAKQSIDEEVADWRLK